MSKSTLEETKAAHAAQIADILKTSHPGLTPGQIATIQQECAAVVGDWGIAPLNRELNQMTVQGLTWKHPEFTRRVPTHAEAQAHLEAKWLADFEAEYLPATVKVTLARQVSGMTPDDLLQTVPATATPDTGKHVVSELEMLDARHAGKQLSPEEQHKADSEWLEYTFGPEYANHRIAPEKRSELLRARDANASQSLRADAQRIDNMNVRFGADASDDQMSAQDSIARYRAKQALARAK